MKAMVAGALMGLTALGAVVAPAELQNMEVGGQIIVLGEYYRNIAPEDDGLRIPGTRLRGRPIGTGLGQDVFSGFAFDNGETHSANVSQWTRLSVEADFTDGVSSYIEFDHVTAWGTEFRANYLTGLDGTGAGNMHLYQAYIQTEETFGLPLSTRIGRQELRLGSEWLSGGNDDGPAPSWGLSFDGIRLTYGLDHLTLDAWALKLAERSGFESDGDMDFYGLYGSYTGIENVSLDAYWMYLRDGSSVSDTTSTPGLEWFESVAGVDD